MQDSIQENANRFKYEMEKKSKAKAYLLWFLTGLLGGHRFYCQKKITAFVQLFLTFGVIGGLLSHDTPKALLLLCVNWCWLFIDLFLIPAMVRKNNLDIAKKYNLNLVNIYPSL